jgi:hypothetical protein
LEIAVAQSSSVATSNSVLALAAQVVAHRSGMTRGQAEAVLVDVSQELGVATDELAALVVNTAVGQMTALRRAEIFGQPTRETTDFSGV